MRVTLSLAFLASCHNCWRKLRPAITIKKRLGRSYCQVSTLLRSSQALWDEMRHQRCSKRYQIYNNLVQTSGPSLQHDSRPCWPLGSATSRPTQRSDRTLSQEREMPSAFRQWMAVSFTFQNPPPSDRL